MDPKKDVAESDISIVQAAMNSLWGETPSAKILMECKAQAMAWEGKQAVHMTSAWARWRLEINQGTLDPEDTEVKEIRELEERDRMNGMDGAGDDAMNERFDTEVRAVLKGIALGGSPGSILVGGEVLGELEETIKTIYASQVFALILSLSICNTVSLTNSGYYHRKLSTLKSGLAYAPRLQHQFKRITMSALSPVPLQHRKKVN